MLQSSKYTRNGGINVKVQIKKFTEQTYGNTLAAVKAAVKGNKNSKKVKTSIEHTHKMNQSGYIADE